MVDHETPEEAGSDGWCEVCVHCELPAEHPDEHDCECENL